MARLSEEAITAELTSLAGWTRQGETIRKIYRLPDFPAAIAFVTRVGFLAEAAQHHPEIDIRWVSVSLTLSTHDAGGLTAQDFALAAAIDALLR